MSFVFHYKRQLITFVASVVLSLALVTMMAFGATYVDTDSIGIGTDTPGAALGVKGAAIFEGFVSAGYFTSTSTADSWILGGLGVGTTTVSDNLNKDGGLAVEGGAIIGEGLTVSYVKATSTVASSFGGNLGAATTSPAAALSVIGSLLVNNTASSTFFGGVHVKDVGGITTNSGLNVTAGDILSAGKLTVTSTATSSVAGDFTIDTTTLVVEANGNNVGIATTTFPSFGDNSETVKVSIGAGTASTTMYIAGGPTVGSSIILKSSNGSNCILINANSNSVALGAPASLETLITAKVIACPTP